MFIDVPDTLTSAVINTSSINKNWRSPTDYSFTQSIGDKWYKSRETILLKAPSAVMPEAFNYVINSEHTDFYKVKLVATTDLVPDERIEQILKRNKP